MINTETPKSSNIKNIEYNTETTTMIVHFKQGGVYSYSSVPLAMYDKFIHAQSVGKFFHTYIKPQFKASKIK